MSDNFEEDPGTGAPTFYPGDIRQGNKPDRTISSSVTFVTLASISFAIIISNASKRYLEESSFYVMFSLMIIFIMVGFSCMTYIFITAYKNRKHMSKSNRPLIDYSSKTRLHFLLLFGTGSILKTSLEVAADIECVNKYDDYSYIISCVIKCSTIVYMCYEISFVAYFRKVKFDSSHNIAIALLFILLTNATMWMNSLLSDATHLTNSTEMSNYTDELFFANCYLNSTVLDYSSKLSPVLSPMRSEYNLLAVWFILLFWSSTASKVEETTIQLVPAESMQSMHLENGDSIAIQRWKRHQNPVSTIIAVSVGIISNVPMLATVMLHIWILPESESVDIINNTLQVVQKSTWLLLVYSCFHVYSTYGEPKRTTKSFKYSELILILATAGAMVATIPIVIVGLQSESFSGMLTIIHGVVDSLVNINQTLLLLLAARQAISAEYEGFFAFHHMCLLISISNFLCWFLDTISMKKLSSLDVILSDNALWIRKMVIVPIFLFYRFTSSIEFYNLYHLHKKL